MFEYILRCAAFPLAIFGAKLFDAKSNGPFGLLHSQYREYQADSFAINKLKSQKNTQGLYEGAAYFRQKKSALPTTSRNIIGTHPSLTSRIKRLKDVMKEQR